MKKYAVFGLLIAFLSFSLVLAENYHLNVSQSVVINGNTISLDNVGSSGSVRISINGLSHTVSGTGKYAGFEITVVDYYYSDVLNDRAATLGISTYTSSGALKAGESTVFGGKTIVLENVGSTGAVMVSVDGIFCTVSGNNICNSVKITVVDYYYSDVKVDRWALLSFDIVTTTTTTIATCTDSDGGKNYYLKGIVTIFNEGSPRYYHDKCVVPIKSTEIVDWYIKEDGVYYNYNDFGNDECSGVDCNNSF